MNPNRRDFLRRSIASALGGASLYSALGNLQLVHAAANAAKGGVFADYKALVCVFLHGGNDSFNTIVPRDNTNYQVYSATRPAMLVPQDINGLRALNPLATHLPGDGGLYSLHPSMPELATLFNGGQAAVVANVGPLLEPLTKAQYQADTRRAPAQLFSHDDQANFWQTSRSDDANADGWGGRVADLLDAGANPNGQVSMTMSLGSQSLFQRGNTVDQYVMSPCYSDGFCTVERIDYLGAYQNALGAQSFNALAAQGTQAHVFERAYANGTRRAIANYETLRAVLNPLPAWSTPFPLTGIGGQLRQVANLINVRNTLGMKRQVFFVGLGGFDTHDEQIDIQTALLGQLSAAMHAFYQATVQMGIAANVTQFTASDFGRTLSTNGDGTDHGWGGHHFVLGGAVRGQRFYGRMPSLAKANNPDDAAYGQVIPTTSVDQYAATLATWFGVAPGDLDTLFPLLYRFPTSDLGFMA
jgi:uncharacterized protein (DUF1501 family)